MGRMLSRRKLCYATLITICDVLYYLAFCSYCVLNVALFTYYWVQMPAMKDTCQYVKWFTSSGPKQFYSFYNYYVIMYAVISFLSNILSLIGIPAILCATRRLKT